MCLSTSNFYRIAVEFSKFLFLFQKGRQHSLNPQHLIIKQRAAQACLLTPLSLVLPSHLNFVQNKHCICFGDEGKRASSIKISE